MRHNYIVLDGYCKKDRTSDFHNMPCEEYQGKIGPHCIGCGCFSYKGTENTIVHTNEQGIVATSEDREKFRFDRDNYEQEAGQAEQLEKIWTDLCRAKISEIPYAYRVEKDEHLGIKYECPCCGYKTLGEEPPGTFHICCLCGWEDDEVQLDDPDYWGGANECSLNECREQFFEEIAIGVIEGARLRTGISKEDLENELLQLGRREVPEELYQDELDELYTKLMDYKYKMEKAIQLYMYMDKLKVDWLRADVELQDLIASLRESEKEYKASMQYFEYLEKFITMFEIE